MATVHWRWDGSIRGGVPQTEEHVANAKKLYAEALKSQGRPEDTE